MSSFGLCAPEALGGAKDNVPGKPGRTRRGADLRRAEREVVRRERPRTGPRGTAAASGSHDAAWRRRQFRGSKTEAQRKLLERLLDPGSPGRRADAVVADLRC